MRALSDLGRHRRQRDELRIVMRLFVATRPRQLLLGGALAALTVLMGMALLGLSGWFIAATALAGLQAATALIFDVFMPSAGIRLLALGRTFSRYGERLVTHDSTLAVLASLRERLFRGWAQPEAARRLSLRPARLLFRLTSDIEALESAYLRLIVPAGAALGAALLAGVVLGFVDLWLGLAMMVWLVFAGIGIALAVARRARPAAVRRGLALEALRSRAVDLVAGQTDLAMAGRLAAQCDAVADADRRLARADLALNRLEAQAGFAYSLAGTATLAAVLIAVGVLAQSRADGAALGAPAAALVLLTALAAMEPFAALRRGALEAGRTWLAARRLAPRIEADQAAAGTSAVESTAPRASAQEADAACSSPPLPADPHTALSLDAITFSHARSCALALDIATLRIGRNERVAIVGASGAGKSTLLSLVAGEVTPTSGRIEALPCTWLTQRTELFQDDLRDNLRLAAPNATDAQLWSVLDAAGLASDVRALAQGLSTPLGEGGIGLSGGQSRRLALARLLLRDADVWLLDEPTEALDADTARDVMERLREHASHRTVLIATHLRREAALADRLICIERGRIVADLHRGSPQFDAALASMRPD